MISTECAKCIHDEVCGIKTCVKETETMIKESRIGCIHPDIEVAIKCRKYSERGAEIKAEMCDKYCKMPDQYNPEEWEKVIQNICGNCPLIRL